MAQTLFERSGGFSAVSKIVMDFYERILDSEKAGDFFEDIEIEKLVDHQTKFIASLMDGPASFTDEHIRHVHTPLSIDDASFDEMVGILAATLKDHGLAQEDVDVVIEKIAARRDLIVI